MGSMAVDYVKARLPFELVARAEFAAGDFSAALKNAHVAVHKALLQCGLYRPELPKYDFTSGTTVAIALVTQNDTYFSSLGNSPIVVMRKNADEKKPLPEPLFPGFHEDDLQRLKESGIFLLRHYYPRSNDPRRIEIFGQMLEKKEFRHGFSDLHVLGSIGDSIYEPENYNLFSEIGSSFKRKDSTIHSLSHEIVLKHFKKHKGLEKLMKHLTIHDKRIDQSWIIGGMFEQNFPYPPPIKHSPLARIPHVKQIPNADMDWFTVLSDGVISKTYEQDEGAMQSIKVLMDYYFEKEPRYLMFTKWLWGEFDDDMSGIFVKFAK